MRFLNWIPHRSLMSMQHELKIQLRLTETDLMNEDPPAHLAFVLSCDVLVEYISIKMFISIRNTMDYL